MAIKTAPYNAADLRQLRAQLQRMLQTVDEAVDWTEQEETPLYVFKMSSQLEGTRRLGVFEKELSESLIAAKSGKPYTAETLKPRAKQGQNAATQVSSSGVSAEDQRMIDEVDAELAKEAKRRAPRKKSAGKGGAKRGGRKKSGG